MPDELDPREEAAVRRLLGQARHDAPVPVEVASRIDRALAGLGPADVERPDDAADPAGTPSGAPPANVVAMARTRRHRATALLVAAAAIVVVGIGVGQAVRPAEQDATSAADDASAAATRDRSDPVDREGTAESGAARNELDDSAGGAAAAEAPETDTEGLLSGSAATTLRLRSDPPTVRESRFAADVRAVRRRLASPVTSPRAGDGAPTRVDFACDRADWGPGRTVAVLYDLAPAVLVLRPPAGDTQVVDLVQCGSGAVLRSVTLTRG